MGLSMQAEAMEYYYGDEFAVARGGHYAGDLFQMLRDCGDAGGLLLRYAPGAARGCGEQLEST
eukprot:7766939-Pyramimonas_sp.AAC.1